MKTENIPDQQEPTSKGSVPELVVLCECRNWARLNDGVEDKGTDHHPRCPRVDDSLIDVWRVSYDGESYVIDREPDNNPQETVTRERMHREIYDNLPEFNGF